MQLALRFLPPSSSPDPYYQRCSCFADIELTHICQTASWTVLSWRCPMAPGVDLWKAAKLDTAVSPPTDTTSALPVPLSHRNPHPHCQHLWNPPTTAPDHQEEQYVREATANDAFRICRDAETITGKSLQSSGTVKLHGFNCNFMKLQEYLSTKKTIVMTLFNNFFSSMSVFNTFTSQETVEWSCYFCFLCTKKVFA